jgi:hypothetical protein
MKANKKKFESCGRDSITVQTGTAQKIMLRFTVGANGRVTDATVDQMQGPDPDLYDCVVKVVKGITFQKPHDDQPKEITYPLVLRPE